MRKLFWTLVFKLWGWKTVGAYPKQYKKAILVAGPHTSNWDFPLGLGSRAIQGFPANFMIKDDWTKKPIIGPIIVKIGGVAVDRSKNKKVSMTEATIQAMKERDEFVLCIAPEGTRKYQPKLKTGFWHIAKGANIPMVAVSFDWPTKTIHWGEAFFPTDDKEADMRRLVDFMCKQTGYVPEFGIKPLSEHDCING